VRRCRHRCVHERERAVARRPSTCPPAAARGPCSGMSMCLLTRTSRSAKARRGGDIRGRSPTRRLCNASLHNPFWPSDWSKQGAVGHHPVAGPVPGRRRPWQRLGSIDARAMMVWSLSSGRLSASISPISSSPAASSATCWASPVIIATDTPRCRRCSTGSPSGSGTWTWRWCAPEAGRTLVAPPSPDGDP
jgi:hypothetical protein